LQLNLFTANFILLMTTKVNKTKQIAKKIAKWTGYFFGLFLLYVVIMLIYGTMTDFQPEEKIGLIPQAPQAMEAKKIDKAELKLINWNIGFGGLGGRANFFYDAGGFFFANGKMVRSPREDVEYYLKGIDSFLKAERDADFILLQEVDSMAHRSYKMNQIKRFSDIFAGYQYVFGVNFNVGYVPMPVARPWDVIGQVYSGIVTYLRYPATEAVRYQLPGDFGWPMRIFNLDRCMVAHRIPTEKGNDLVLVNIHFSAYDAKGVLRKQEMDYMQKYVLSEYEKGNYVIVGADWNQCPPDFVFNKYMPSMVDSVNYPGNIAADFMPNGWTWAADTTLTTNRKLNDTYIRDQTFSTLVDYYLLSPNVELLSVKGIDLDYQYADHQPVRLQVRLSDFVQKDSLPQ
jgi:endonuclease/exonuclease/phosphatase family metal-dependent hydrolase